ncbi:hypothetical protein BC629DRAFT_1266079, partial [Irpex lacteus]
WTTADQLAWLKERVSNFLAAREKGTLEELWPQLYQGWFDAFPEPEPSAEDLQNAGGSKDIAITNRRKARESQVYWWYNNHCRAGSAGNGRQKVLPLGQPKRKLHMFQAY